ncbi:MAG TPA: hypothetical protein VMR45_02750 [Patescibacteria group bacterium]|nr:hypothetical protein [Patescibacteria group bacterium]
MRATLHSDLKLSGNRLYDLAIGARYSLTKDGAWLLRRLAKDGHVKALTDLIIQKKGIEEQEARQAIYSLLGQINLFGGITLSRLGSYRMTNVLTHIEWRVRYPGTISGFIRSMLRAYSLLIALATISFGALKIVAGSNLPVLWTALPAILFASCVLHEAGHTLAARKFKIPFVFLSHVGYSAILYAQPGVRVGRKIAICGPLPVGLFYLILALLPAIWPIRLSLAITSALHLISLLPITSDGKTIWRRDG